MPHVPVQCWAQGLGQVAGSWERGGGDRAARGPWSDEDRHSCPFLSGTFTSGRCSSRTDTSWAISVCHLQPRALGVEEGTRWMQELPSGPGDGGRSPKRGCDTCGLGEGDAGSSTPWCRGRYPSSVPLPTPRQLSGPARRKLPGSTDGVPGPVEIIWCVGWCPILLKIEAVLSGICASLGPGISLPSICLFPGGAQEPPSPGEATLGKCQRREGMARAWHAAGAPCLGTRNQIIPMPGARQWEALYITFIFQI